MEEAEPGALWARASAPATVWVQEPLHVLLIAPEPADAALVRDVLRERAPGSSLSVAQCFEDALAHLPAAGGRRPHVVLVDLGLRGALPVLAAIKRDPAARNAALVVLAGREDDVAFRRACELRSDAYVIKPLSAHQVRNAIASVLRFCTPAVPQPGVN